MNQGLKACLSVGFATIKLVLDSVAKKGTATALIDLEQVIADLPQMISGISDLKTEVLALNQAANEEDLLAAVFAGVTTLGGSAKASAIVQASVQLASGLGFNSYALYQAIKS